MLAIERRNKIKKILIDKKSIRVTDLVKEFNVSEETIRRDLNQLETEGFLKKNYGGAILVDEFLSSAPILPIQKRKEKFFEEKQLIGKAAGKLIQDNQTIIIDAGSTTWHVASESTHKENLKVITNAMNIAEECTKNQSASIYLLGGKLRRNSLSTVGPQAEEELKKYNANYVFLGTSGVSLRQGITSSDLYEAEMKKAMVSAGEKIVVLADHSKFANAGLTSFCDFEKVDILITSDLVSAQVLEEVRQKGVEVIVVDMPASSKQTSS
ncbi:DeoR/GlpR family DNA-binding transcription regulator [Gracilibacillus alcaliphilus]|uniref:DeoR/GlpR family DNA-binding transcription regulator n=1 Tax=Gracilibacillus alcaliphilus TaxID=1401441 RepID=UPI0019590300|nr:DeoR/GlpR family DNA-binding transcription regulator [Gracilibacillus alcaliphilus]MBM7677550.1 DeoR/GlpR family transcriptional regulator of sugar metabolism [Gracilibacillus alcaliphilus]